jgi:hypothetical protein
MPAYKQTSTISAVLLGEKLGGVGVTTSGNNYKSRGAKGQGKRKNPTRCPFHLLTQNPTSDNYHYVNQDLKALYFSELHIIVPYNLVKYGGNGHIGRGKWSNPGHQRLRGKCLSRCQRSAHLPITSNSFTLATVKPT